MDDGVQGVEGKRINIPYFWAPLTARQLSLDDSTQALVARYHTGQKNILSGSQLPMLEVFRLGEHIMDLILVTLVYIEKLRDDE